MKQYVCLNHEWVEPHEAKISVFDRGFLFGDGIYEVISVFNGQTFLAEEHLDRLYRSLNLTHIPQPLSQDLWHQYIQEMIHRNELMNGYIYIQITRGAPSSRRHFCPPNTQPNWLMMSQPIAKHSESIIGYLHPDERWSHCHIKAISLLPNVLASISAHNSGAHEAILHRNGLITEGASSNLFLIKDNVIKTPPLSQYILPGIIREFTLKLCHELNLPVKIEPIKIEDLYHADASFITSSTRLIKPLIKLEDYQFDVNHSCILQLIQAINHAAQITEPHSTS